MPKFCAMAISVFRKLDFGIDFRGVREAEAAAQSREKSSVRCGHLARTASSGAFARTGNPLSVKSRDEKVSQPRISTDQHRFV